MKISIDKSLLNEAIGHVYEMMEKTYIPNAESFVRVVWDEYEVLKAKEKEDKKRVDINLLMAIPGVYGADHNWREKTVRLRTRKGYKIYKTGRFTMDSIASRVSLYLSH